MIEVVFVIVVVGILAAIAIPKFSATRDDAVITKAKSTIASIRSALSSEVQKRILRGNYTPISNLGGEAGFGKDLFDFFDGDATGNRVLEYPVKSCKDAAATGCWVKSGNNKYKFIMPPSIGGEAVFVVNNNRFECEDPDSEPCKLLER
ncbi:MAG: ABC transporter permease [Epsilonproteobacteria bacterium]|nr:ABC transporter permease [Campylobacterota bacterium]